MEFVAVFDRDDVVLFAPDDEGWLVDEVRVLFEAVGVPVSRCGEDRAMAIGGVEWAADRFDALLGDHVMIGLGQSAVHSHF